MTLTRAAKSAVRIVRFTLTQRVVHWVNALLFATLIVTAAFLYFGSLFGVVLARYIVEQVHLWCGLALPIPVLLSLIGPWGATVRRDFRRFDYWTREEIRWLRTLGRSPLRADKFNPGQKLNAIFIGVAILIMLATGSIMQWFRFFSISWRVGATDVHDVFAYVIVAVVVGHIYTALTHPESLWSMVKGKVSEAWARVHAPAWLDEVRDVSRTPDSGRASKGFRGDRDSAGR